MIKLVATDIDGTILIPEGEFTQKVKDCIRRISSNGIKVVLVTGRMNAAAVRIAEDLGLNTPVVSYQGGLVTLGNQKLCMIYSHSIGFITIIWNPTIIISEVSLCM